MLTSKRAALTLPELLVVIGIIALLIAMLLPSLGSARAESRFVACAAQLRVIGQLVRVYSVENAGRLPRGPAHTIGTAIGAAPERYLLSRPDVATNQLWLGHAYWDADDPQTQRPPQYSGLGLVSRQAGRTGNEMFFCPADDQPRIAQDAPRIGQPGHEVRGSYLYRQLDMTSAPVQRIGELDDLKHTDCSILADGVTGGHVTYNLDVEVLALDYNNLHTGEWKSSNHGGRRVNILYQEGGVRGFDNEKQVHPNGQGAGWASVSGAAYTDFPGDSGNAVEQELDRILIAADYSRLGDPWRSPFPVSPIAP
jgi:type II secretory pathway pseudopilin PulG